MRFTPLPLAGAWLIDLEPRADDRGFFARAWCREEFAAHGLVADLTQCNLSWNARRGTLRGMHWQAEPHAETKMVRCVAGAVHDVIVDLRPDSPTFHRWHAVELSAANRTALHIPTGFAHGFQTLADGSELYYQMSVPFQPAGARGARWNDPAFAIPWPLADPILSARDAAFPDVIPEKLP